MSAPYDPEHITYFAETDFRNQRIRFGIKSRDRTRHMYVIGRSGVGKSTMLENMAIQDIQHGDGLAVLDPHGSFAEKLLDYIPMDRIKDVIYFAPFDIDYPISFNILEDVGYEKRHFVASGLMSTFKKIWVDAWSARMEYILNNILLALLEYPGATILGVNRMLSDKDFRKEVVSHITDPGVKSFWVDEFAKYGERYMQEAGASIQNKIGQFIANPLIRNIIGQPTSSFNIREVMDNQKILIINLSKGRIGEQNTSLLGSMLITKIYLGAMSRAEESPARMAALSNFYFYVDEFQSFANETFAGILSEARKYKLALIIAHQYVSQMEEQVRDAVFGNVGTTISFRVGALDAELMEKVLAPQFTQNDLINLGMAQIYLSLMINDIGSPAFSARTLPPIPRPAISYRDDCIEWTRKNYAVYRKNVESTINDWYISGNSKLRDEEDSQQNIDPRFKPARLSQNKNKSKNDTPEAKSPEVQNKHSVSENYKKPVEISAGPSRFKKTIKKTPSTGFIRKPLVFQATENNFQQAETPLPEPKDYKKSESKKSPVGHIKREPSQDKHQNINQKDKNFHSKKDQGQKIDKVAKAQNMTPALQALLSTLNIAKQKDIENKPLEKEKPVVETIEKGPEPFPGEPVLKNSVYPLKEPTRAATIESKNILKEALAKAMVNSNEKVDDKESTDQKSNSYSGREASYEDIRKVLD